MNNSSTDAYPYLPSQPMSPAPGSPGAAALPTTPPRGRPSGYSEKVLEMLRDLIRRFGLSDSAAAERLGMSASTISRWKREFPDVALGLRQAREECRLHHLEKVIKSAEAEGGRGWRASAWLLERLFPGDYSPRMAERLAYDDLQADRQEREEHEATEQLERERQATPPVEESWPPRNMESPGRNNALPPAQNEARPSEGDCHNCRNSPEAEGTTVANHSAPPQGTRVTEAEGMHGQHPITASATDCHNCRNSGEPGFQAVPAGSMPWPEMGSGGERQTT